MAEIVEDVLVRWSLIGDDKVHFLSAMSKIWSEVNKVGFNDRIGLTRDERIVFNDVVEQLAKYNYDSED